MSQVYLLVLAHKNDLELVQSYQQAAGPIMKKHGAQMPPQSFKVESILAGSLKPTIALKVGFPDVQSIKNAFEDPDYLPLIEDRDKGLTELSISIITEV